MTRIFIALALVIMCSSSTQVQDNKVFICNSTGATKYHLDKDCRGLNSCKSEVVKVTLSEAVKRGKKELCGWED